MAGRKKNPVQSHQLTITLSGPVFDLLKKIARSGFSGRTEAAVAEELLRKGLNADGLISEIIRSRVKKLL